MNDTSALKNLARGVLAGIFIALGGAVFLKLGGVVGAVMFSFGLVMVVHFKTPLYTGTAGFINLRDVREWIWCLVVLVANIGGCYLVSLVTSGIDGTDLIRTRISAGLLHCFTAAVGCGFIMTVVVRSARDGIYGVPVTILLGVPLFILLGFYHSIADAFYFFTAWNCDLGFLAEYAPYYGMTVVGNFVGCNVPNVLYYNQTL